MVQDRMFTPGSFPYFLTSQLFYSNLPENKASFHGKTVIVTGANIGLGFEASKTIARLGAKKLILAVRTLKKGEAAKAEIDAAAQSEKSNVEVWPLDLSSTESVKDFAARASKLERVDVLLENAGMSTAEFREMEGEEATIKTNVISTFLLAFLMLPKMKETADKFNTRPTLTVVSSEVHYWTAFPEGFNAAEGSIFDDLSDKGKADMKDRYQVSKLLEVFVIRKMAALRPEYPVTINYVNPGLCHSELTRETGALSPVWLFKRLLARTTHMGSRTLVDAASSGPVTHGQYLSDCDIVTTSKYTRSPEGVKLGDRIFKELCERLEKQAPGCTSNL